MRTRGDIRNQIQKSTEVDPPELLCIIDNNPNILIKVVSKVC